MDNAFILELRPIGNKCSRNCRHCYQPKPSMTEGVLDFENLGRFLKNTLEYIGQKKFPGLKVVFHGGEPLDKYNWIRDAIELIKIKCCDINVEFICHSHGFQSEEKLLGLLDEKVGFGISFTFPEHNIVTKNDIPPAVYVANKHHRLYSVQIVLTQSFNVTREKLFSFLDLLPENINIKFIPCFAIYKDKEPGLSWEGYYQKLVEIYRLLKGTNYWQKFFFEPISWMVSPNQENSEKNLFRGCRFGSTCSIKNSDIVSLSVDYDGNIYVCNRFAAIKEQKIGNISEDLKIPDLQPQMDRIKKTIYLQEQVVYYCSSCNLFLDGLCIGIGGCPFHGIYHFENQGRDLFCEGEKLFYSRFQYLLHNPEQVAQ